MLQIPNGLKIFNVDKLVDNLTKYIETKIELIQLDVKEELIGGIAKAISLIIIIVFALLSVLFISLGLGSMLNDYLESTYFGYLIIGLFYLILTLIVFSGREKIVEQVKLKANQSADVEESDITE